IDRTPLTSTSRAPWSRPGCSRRNERPTGMKITLTSTKTNSAMATWSGTVTSPKRSPRPRISTVRDQRALTIPRMTEPDSGLTMASIWAPRTQQVEKGRTGNRDRSHDQPDQKDSTLPRKGAKQTQDHAPHDQGVRSQEPGREGMDTLRLGSVDPFYERTETP